ncbi:MAG: hypothetical protein Q7R68_11160 [Nitrospirales bacterium]|nr:hypothetical protein [Nitrospirales bacterium]
MVSVHVEGANAEEVRTQLRALIGQEIVQTLSLPTKAVEEPAAKRESKKKDEPKAAPAQTEAPKTPETPYAPVGKLIKDTVAAKGREAVVAVLAKHGVTLGSQLKPEQYDAVSADLKAL